MTCIVAVVSNGIVHMGADSLGSDGWSGIHVGNPKCFITGEFLIGCTSTFRSIDLLRYMLEVPKVHPDTEEDADRYMRTVFINAVRKCFKDNGAIRKNNEIESGSNFLVGYRGLLYEVQNDFSVLNMPCYGSSVGSGADVARGSLFTTKDMDLPPLKRLYAALQAAVEVTVSVRAPFVFLDTAKEE